MSQAVRGWLEGVIQPVILSVQARSVGRHQQGAVVGLRQTGQRLTSIIIPPLMGGIADRWGVSESFFILGAFMLLLCLPLMLMTRRAARLATTRGQTPRRRTDLQRFPREGMNDPRAMLTGGFETVTTMRDRPRYDEDLARGWYLEARGEEP